MAGQKLPTQPDPPSPLTLEKKREREMERKEEMLLHE